jgi:hypothetical protein
MPSREEILAQATKLFMEERVRLGLPAITPEEEELKEGNYWDRARSELMSGVKSQLEGYLAYLEGEAAKIREELGIEKIVPEERITELENKLSSLTERYKTSKARLEEAREELRRIKEKAPLLPPRGLSKEQIEELEATFRRMFEERGVTRIPSAVLRDELETLKETLKETERSLAFDLAHRRIVDVAESILPRPPAPPVMAPPPGVEEVTVPAVTYLGPRRRRYETFTCMQEGCFETVTADRDLEHRVRLIPVLKADTPRTGPIFEPLLRFPPRFYFVCSRHKKERYGYTGIFDALAFLIRETEVGEKVTVTEATLREIGLDEADLAEVRKERVKYLPEPGSPSTF